MKTIIIIFAFCLLPFTLLSQVDTANFEFKANGSDGKYTMLQNKVTYLGKGAGQIVTPLQFDVSAVDTSKWLFIPIGSDGTYRLVENKETFMGMDSGTVRAQVVSGITSIGTATTSSGAVTLNTLAGVITTDNASGNSNCEVVVTNSKITSSSVLVISVINTGASTTYCSITNLADGTFTINARNANGDTFSNEIQFTFLITN